jgi:hypothetical protein
MPDVKTRGIPLKWDVFVTAGIPSVTSDLLPGAKQRLWSPISSTLISGKRDAVLVDTFITIDQARALADWVTSERQELDDHLRDARPWRPFLRCHYSSGTISARSLLGLNEKLGLNAN